MRPLAYLHDLLLMFVLLAFATAQLYLMWWPSSERALEGLLRLTGNG